ncbi:hypothetical protein F4778DRAFT_761899 [Xylariomycetidae sp. FL2044]|nr:hypothetical protein F4778DRAFT_761899 [Xylariomycetidae sp. FL2044]
METWKGRNYYTTNQTTWVELMNLSTVEWGLPHFPPNVVAIPGGLNDSSFHFDNSTYVIEYAGGSAAGQSPVESVVFGAASAAAIVIALIWLVWNRATLLSPPLPEEADMHTDAVEHGINGFSGSGGGGFELHVPDNEQFVTAAAFKDKLHNFYYEPVESELELYEKDVSAERIDVEDVEAATALLRRMYMFDLELWSEQSSPYVTEGKRAETRDKSDAILAEVRKTVDVWDEQAGWHTSERQQLGQIVGFFEMLPKRRYGSREGR